MKTLTIAVTALVMLLMAPAFGEYQIVPLWNYNISLDFGGKNVTI
jgi:hypothetical protein